MPYTPSSSAISALLRAIAKMEAENPGEPKIAELKRKALLRLAEIQRRGSHRRLKMLVLKPAPGD
jgi:hypothetical protein